MRTLNLNEYRFVYYNTRKAPSIVEYRLSSNGLRFLAIFRPLNSSNM